MSASRFASLLGGGDKLALIDAIAQVWTKMIVWTFSPQGVA
jgi:hypothetical protein